jgi:predicted MFS family arabinose efflux permease
MHKHYEKVICACCFLFLFTNIGFASTSFGVYQPYIVEVVGDTAGSIVLASRTLASLLSMFFVNRYYFRLGCRKGVLIATLLTAAGFLLYSQATGMLTFCLAASLTGMGYGLGGMVCMTTLISRWYHDNVGTAVGVATAGSGVSTLVISPLAAQIIAASSLSTAFLCEACLAALIGAVVFTLVRDKPEDLGLQPFTLPQAKAATKQGGAPAATGQPQADLPRGAFVAMMVAMAFVGVVAVDGFNYLSILLTSNGVDKTHAATLIAVSGACLTVSKFVVGKVFDLIGVFRGSIAFFCILLAGCLMCCLMGTRSAAVEWAAVILFGFGMSLGTVGISVWSLRLSTPQRRAKVIKNFQIAYALGGFVFNFVPGALMDLCGSYVVSYVIITVLALACAVITLGIYWKYAVKAAR